MASDLASEIVQVQRDLGISGEYDVGEDDEIGYVDVGNEYDVGATARSKMRRMGAQMGRVTGPEKRGVLGVWTMPATAALTLAAAAVGNLVFTPNRTIKILDVMLDCYVAAAVAAVMMPAALKVTNITVQGRPQWPGAGEVPLSCFRPLNPGRNKPLFNYGDCDASQQVVVTFRNDDAATAHIVTGALRVICVM
jgi:hypothetical protein